MKRYQGGDPFGADAGAGAGADTSWTTSKSLIGMSLLLSIFTVIIPVLASFNSKLPVKIMLGFYIVFLFFYGVALDDSQIPRTLLGTRQIGAKNTLMNSVTNSGIICICLPATFLVLALTYKHYTVFLPVSFALIGLIVLINFFFSNNTLANFLTCLFAVGATGTMIVLLVQQFYVNTKAGNPFRRNGTGGGGDDKPNYV